MIPVARPILGVEEKNAVQEVLASGMLASGSRVKEFEEKFAQKFGATQAIATSSGTTSLQALMFGLGLGPGDRVLTTPFTFIATTNSILGTGARPVFADIDPRSFNLDPEQAEEILARDSSIKAILVVHLFGLPCLMADFEYLAQKYGVDLIEDAAQAHGAAFAERYVGNFGRAGMFSFYPTKNMTTGEGGMVVTSDDVLAKKIRLYINHGASERYNHRQMGYNYRMTEMAGAMGLVQLKRLDKFVATRRTHAQFYDQKLGMIPEVEIPYIPPQCYHSYNLYTLRCQRRDELQNHLKEEGIGTGIHYPRGLHQQPYYKELGFGDYSLPKAEQAGQEVLSIPVHPGLNNEELQKISRAIISFYEARR